MDSAATSVRASLRAGMWFGDSAGAPPQPAGRETPEQVGTGRGSLLIIDDEPDALEAVFELFKAEGYDVRVAGNGREALSLLGDGVSPCLILLDLRMPEMDGWGFCEALLEDPVHSRIPIAIVTASAAVDYLPRRNVDAGMFVKPVDFRRLLRTVRRFCS
jgi:CheY-like chemotaxis protein